MTSPDQLRKDANNLRQQAAGKDQEADRREAEIKVAMQKEAEAERQIRQAEADKRRAEGRTGFFL